MRSAASQPLAVVDLVTADAIVVLRSGDELQPDWLDFCARALECRPRMAFAGTWGLLGDWCEPSFLDVAPELYPLDQGSRLTRVLVRTRPGELLVDLFDSDLAALGEIGYIWRAIGHWGPGHLHPQPRLKLAGEPPQLVDTNLYQYLVATCGATFGDRWGLVAGVLEQRRQFGHHPGRDAALVAQTRMIDERDVLLRRQDELVRVRDEALARANAELRDLHANLRRPQFYVRALARAARRALGTRPRQ